MSSSFCPISGPSGDLPFGAAVNHNWNAHGSAPCGGAHAAYPSASGYGHASQAYAGSYGGAYYQPGYYVQQRPPPEKVNIDGKEVYLFGTGTDRLKKTEGTLVLCSQSGEIKIQVPNRDPLTAAEFAQLAKHKWKRPRQSIKLKHTDQSLEDFEYAMHALPPGSCRRYPHEHDTEEQRRAELADTILMRQLKKAHERSVRRSKKRCLSSDPSHVSVIGQAELPSLRAGLWASSLEEPAEGVSEEEVNRKVDKLHRTWRKNSAFLYDLCMIQMLECPSLTVQWLPEVRTVPGYPNFQEHRLLLGTYSSAMPQEEEEERVEKRGRKAQPKAVKRDYLMVAALQLPRSTAETREEMDAEERQENNALYSQAEVHIVGRYGHKGEVNRARYMPDNPRIVATKSGGAGGELYLFDLAALGNKLLTNRDAPSIDHYLTLRGHSKEGYGLAWNERKAGYLLSGSYDHRVCVWDVAAEAGKSRSGCRELEPLNCLKGHTDAVADVAWNPHHESVFYSVGDDKKLVVWDLRAPAHKPAAAHVISDYAVNSVDCNAFSQHLLATASGSKGKGVVCLWDDRLIDTRSSSSSSSSSAKPLQEVALHSDVVDVVSWSPDAPDILASGSRDRKVHIIDTHNIPSVLPAGGVRESNNQAEEVMFVHAGHRHNVSDIAWNATCPWLISSVSDGEDNMQFWQPSQEIWAKRHTHAQDGESEMSVSLDSDDDLLRPSSAPAAAASASAAASSGGRKHEHETTGNLEKKHGQARQEARVNTDPNLSPDIETAEEEEEEGGGGRVPEEEGGGGGERGGEGQGGGGGEGEGDGAAMEDEEASSSAVAAADAQEEEYAGVADTGMEEDCETSECIAGVVGEEEGEQGEEAGGGGADAEATSPGAAAAGTEGEREESTLECEEDVADEEEKLCQDGGELVAEQTTQAAVGGHVAHEEGEEVEGVEGPEDESDEGQQEEGKQGEEEDEGEEEEGEEGEVGA